MDQHPTDIEDDFAQIMVDHIVDMARLTQGANEECHHVTMMAKTFDELARRLVAEHGYDERELFRYKVTNSRATRRG
jgi:hypothetical protein